MVGTGSAAQGRELRTGLRLRGCGGAANRQAVLLPVSRSVRWRRCNAAAFREEGPRFEGCASVLARRAARAWRAFTSCQRSRLGECPVPTWAPGSTVQPQLWLAGPKEPCLLLNRCPLWRHALYCLGVPAVPTLRQECCSPGWGQEERAMCPCPEQQGFRSCCCVQMQQPMQHTVTSYGAGAGPLGMVGAGGYELMSPHMRPHLSPKSQTC